jgi:hypothetical protein
MKKLMFDSVHVPSWAATTCWRSKGIAKCSKNCSQRRVSSTEQADDCSVVIKTKGCCGMMICGWEMEMNVAVYIILAALKKRCFPPCVEIMAE